MGSDTTVNVSKITLTRKARTSESVTIIRTGYGKKTQTIHFNSDEPVTIALEKSTAKTITVGYKSYERGDKSQPVKATFFYRRGGRKDSTVAKGSAEGSVTLPYSEKAAQLCAKAPYFQSPQCADFFPNKDQPPLLFAMARQPVTISITEITTEDGGSITDPTITVDDYTYQRGEHSHDFGARSGKRSIRVFAAGTDTSQTTVAADSDQDVSATLTVLPECSNGLTDDGDDKIDSEDIGCVDEDGNYDPEDNVEKTITVSNSFSYQPDHKWFVSSKERKTPLFANTFSKEFKFAIGEIRFYLTEKQEKGQDGEIAKVEFTCREKGSSVDYDSRPAHDSDIIPDTGEDGWQELAVHGFTKAMFKRDGLDCASRLIHAGSSPGYGQDDVVIGIKNHSNKIRYEADFEPEETPGWQDQY